MPPALPRERTHEYSHPLEHGEPASTLLGVIGAFLFPSDHRGSLGVRCGSGRERKGAVSHGLR